MRSVAALLVALAIAALAAYFALSGSLVARRDAPSDRVISDAGSGAARIRLADLLSRASIDSPLRSIPAAAGIADLGEVQRTSLLDEGFESFDPAAVGWTLQAGNAIAADGAGHVFRLREYDWNSRFGWTIPADPNSDYSFERRVRTSAAARVDFAVVEAKRPTDDVGIAVLEGHYMPGRGDALRIHWPDPPVADGTWQRGSATFHTTPETHALVVIVRPAAGRAEALASREEISFDDLRLDRLELSPTQAIALLKGRSLADGADPELGIEKHGQFPPLGNPDEIASPEDENFSFRYALYAPPPTDLRFAMRVPERAVLHFSTSLCSETRAGDSVRFTVLLVEDGGEQQLFTSKVSADADLCWREAQVDLSRFAGRSVLLVLRTRAEKGSPHPVWGNPVIDVPGERSDPRIVVLIAVDTLRADRLSCYGYARETTPNIDALAADGVRFEQAVSTSNWTCPSFASIFTGLSPSRHGVSSYGPATPLPGYLTTLAERFQEAGWATRAISFKAPLYDGGYDQGFDAAFNVPRDDARADDNLRKALEWLASEDGGRRFLFLHFNDPHQPFTQPAPFDRKFGGDPAAQGIRLPYLVTDDKRFAQRPELQKLFGDMYDGEVAYFDDRVGIFLEALKQRELYRDAVIVFLSDHGEQLWDHGRFGHGSTMLFDEVVRVPLIVKPGAGPFARGASVASQVRVFDAMPTLLELAGIRAQEGLDAQTLVPLLLPGAPRAADRLAVVETSEADVALRTSEWKYILRLAPGKPSRELLFDLGGDPLERTDVSATRGEVLERQRLLTLDYLLAHRPGLHLVALGARASPPVEIRVEGVRAAGTLFGPPPARAAPEGFSFSARGDARPLLVANLEAAGPVRVSGALELAGPVRPYHAGDLEELVRREAVGVFLFQGPAAAAETAPSRTLDARQLEALRALGYTGDDRGER